MMTFLKQVRRAAAAAAVVFGCGVGANPASAQEVIQIDGSSTVYPITEAVADEFNNQNEGKYQITVGVSGTGGGFKKFVKGETDLQNASRPILEKEMADARSNGVEYVELPVAMDALTVVVHPDNDWAESMTVEELKSIWQAGSKIAKWSEVRDGWPDEKIKLYGPGKDSGTFDYFTEAINGKAKVGRSDYTASEDDSVLVEGVAGDKNALGYFGYAYYVENQERLKAVQIDAGDGPVAPSEETVIDGSYKPLSRPLMLYVSVASLERPEVAEFVNFYVKNGADMARTVDYIALPDECYGMAMKRLKARKTGTAFGGKSEVGVKAEELFERELTN